MALNWDELSSTPPGDAPSWDSLSPTKPGPRSLLKEVPIQTYAGATIDLPKQVGQALQWMSSPGHTAHEYGKQLQTWAEEREQENPDMAPQVEGRGIIGRALTTGARALAPSTAVMVPAAVGVAAAPLVGATALTGAAVGSAAGAFGLFGASQAQETYDKLLKSDVDEGEARKAGWINLMIEGGGETIADVAGLKLFGVLGRAVGKGVSPVAGAIAQATESTWLKPFLKQLPKTAAIESSTEFGQNFGEAWVENKFGGKNEGAESPWAQGVQGAEAALGMTILLAPFGMAHMSAVAKQNKKVADALQDPAAPIADRIAASKIVYDDIKAVNPEAAKAWGENSTIAIMGNAPILLDETTAQRNESLVRGAPAEPSMDAITQGGLAKISAAPDADSMIQAAMDATSAPITPAAVPIVPRGARTLEQELAGITLDADAAQSAQVKAAQEDALQAVGNAPTAMGTALQGALTKQDQRDVAGMTEKELDLAARLTRSEDRRQEIADELQRRQEVQNASPVRNDTQQISQGGEAGQQEIRSGAVEGGGDLQFDTSRPADVGGTPGGSTAARPDSESLNVALNQIIRKQEVSPEVQPYLLGAGLATTREDGTLKITAAGFRERQRTARELAPAKPVAQAAPAAQQPSAAAAPEAQIPAPAPAPEQPAQTPGDEVRALALAAQKEAGWNPAWPFIPADLQNADFRKLISNDPALTDNEKQDIFSAGRKLGVVPKHEAAQPAIEPAPVSQAQPAPGTAVEPVVAGTALTEKHPNVVVRQVLDLNSRKLGDMIEPYDGTESGALAAAQRIEDRVRDEYPNASHALTRIGATDENGAPKWAISPNLKHVSRAGTREAAYTWGDMSAAPIPTAETIAEIERGIAKNAKDFNEAKAKQKAGVPISKVDDRFTSWKDYLQNAKRILDAQGENLKDALAKKNAAEALKPAQPALPAESTAKVENASPAAASQAVPAKAPAVRINGQIPADMTVAQLQHAAENAPYFDQKDAAKAELKTRDKRGETIFGKSVDQLDDKQLAQAAKAGKKAIRPLAQAEIEKRAADAGKLAERLKAPGTPETLKSLLDQAGWAERGGHLIRTKTGEAAGEEIIIRTKWVPKSTWWPGRPVQESERYYRAAVLKALSGGKLTGKQTQVVKFMLDLAEYEGEDLQGDVAVADVAPAQEIVDQSPPAADSWSTMTEDEKDNELDGLFGKDTRTAAQAAQNSAPIAQGEVGPAATGEGKQAEVAPVGAAEAIAKHDLPENTGWERGKGRIKDQWAASSNGVQSNYHPTADAAAAELAAEAERVKAIEDAKKREEANAAADKLEGKPSAPATKPQESAPNRSETTTTETKPNVAPSQQEPTVAPSEQGKAGNAPEAFSRAEPWYYSAISRVIDAANMKSAPALGWKAFLQGHLNKGGIKQAEIEATGINDWLATQEGKVTKEQVQAFMEQGGVRVTETIIGGGQNAEPTRSVMWVPTDGTDGPPHMENAVQMQAGDSISDSRSQYRSDVDKGNAFWADEEGNALTNDEAFAIAEQWRKYWDAQEGRDAPKFSDYQLPGSVPGSYRELVLTLPPKVAGYDSLDGIAKQMYGIEYDRLSNQDRAKVQAELFNPKDGAFESSHFPGSNYLAHTRVNDRILPDGKRVLFVEEIQSDRAQKGRQEGFIAPKQPSPGLPSGFEIQQTEHQYLVKDPVSGFKVDIGKGTVGSEKEAREYANRYFWTKAGEADQRNIGKIAPAPFVTKTDSWTALVLKRLLRYAAEGGYDSIAWTRGDQQVERYTSALRKAVDVIEWKKTPEGVQIIGYKGEGAKAGRPIDDGAGGMVQPTVATNRVRRLVEEHGNFGFDTAREAMDNIRAHQDWSDRWGDGLSDEAYNTINQWRSGVTVRRTKVVDTTEKESALSDAIGKSMADRIRNDPNQTGTIEGEGITVSSTGMAAFYDNIVPKLANEISKKLGGAKVGEITIEGRAESPSGMPNTWIPTKEKQQALAITPQMREKIMGGLPLFRQGASTGMPSAEIEQSLSTAISKLTIPTTVWDSVQAARDATGVDIPSTARAMYYGNEVHLIAGNLATPLAAEQAFWHEVEHAGLNHLYGIGSREYQQALTTIALKNANIRMNAQMWRGRYGKDALERAKKYGMTDDQAKRYVTLQSYDEALADLSGANVQISGLKQFLAVAQDFLRSIGLTRIADAMERATDAEALALITQARGAVMRGDAHIGMETAPAYERKPGLLNNASDALSSDPTPEEASKVQSGIEGKSAVEAAQWLSKNSPTADYRLIAVRVARQLVKLEDAGQKFTLNIAHLNQDVNGYLAGKMRGVTSRDFGSNTTDIWLQGADVAGLVGVSYETALHELLHTATQAAIHVGIGNGTTQLHRDVEDLYRVNIAIVKHIQEKIATAGGDIHKLDSFIEKIFAQGHNSLREPGEMVSWALTNRRMQEYLEGIPYQGGTLWTRFVTAIRKMLGLPPSSDTALSEILRITDRLMDAPVQQLHTIAPYMQTNYTGGLRNSTNAIQYAQAKTAFDNTRYLGEGILPNMWAHDILGPDGKRVGTITLSMSGGKPTVLANIEIADSQRAKGYASSAVLDAIKDSPNGELYIYNIQPEAVPFWQKMGVRLDEGNQWAYGNGIATQEGYESVRGQARPETGGTAQEAGRGTEEENRSLDFTTPGAPLQVVIAMRPEQIKSAIGNRGTFGPNNPDIRFSLGSIIRSTPVSGMLDGLMSSPASLGFFKGINTQYHKAVILARASKPEFKAVFDKMQQYLDDINAIANAAEQKAPAIFRELTGMHPKSIREYFKGAASEKDIQAIGPWLNAGTLYGGPSPMDGIVWTDKELQGDFKGSMRVKPRNAVALTSAQLPLYKQARAAIAESLEGAAKSIIYRHVKKYGVTFDKTESLGLVVSTVRDQLGAQRLVLDQQRDAAQADADTAFEAMTKAKDASKAAPKDRRARIEAENAKYAYESAQKTLDALEADIQKIDDLLGSGDNPGTIAKIQDQANSLISHGYMPLKRFGNKTVTAKNQDGKTMFFAAFDGSPLVPGSANMEMNQTAAEIRALHPSWSVTTGIRSERSWQLYNGLSIDALENFLDFLDPETKAELERDKVIQEYLTKAVNNRSVMKELIHRKGTPGFSKDVPRILAGFITSHARNASGMYHISDAKAMVEDIPQEQGDIKDEATDLIKYVTEPAEEATKLRGFLFFHFLGGSVASAAVNATQTVMMTAPYLAQYGNAKRVTQAILSAGKMSVQDPQTIKGQAGDFLKRAEAEGITAPQQIHHLIATASNNPFSSNRSFRGFMNVWGSMFGAVEVFNRRVAFLAAYDMGEMNGLKGEELYDFAKTAVVETQGLYNKGNRPNLSRGTMGSLVFTFKTFSIMYLELLKRLPAKQQLMMLGILMLAAGGEGLPFSEDIMDLIDTLGQWLGFTTNTGKWLGKTVRDTLGEDFERPLLKGLGGMLPLDLHSRLGFQNLLPGTAFFKPSEIDKTRDVAEAVGPLGSVLKSFSDSLQLMARGKWDHAAVGAAPKAVRDIYNGANMAITGKSYDQQGRLAMKDVTVGEAFGKSIGFNPQRASIEGEAKREMQQDKNLRTVRMDEFASDWADGILQQDKDKQAQARRKAIEWNRENPTLRIDMAQMLRSVQERVRAARLTGSQRFIKAAPKAMKSEARESLTH